MAQVHSTRRNRLNPKRRRALKAKKYQEWVTLANSDWPQEHFASHHCPDCHLQYEGEFHWGCTPYPTLNNETCTICATYPTYPIDAYPLTVIAASPYLSPLNVVVKEVRDFYLNFNYLPPFKKIIFNFLVFLIAVVLARKV